MATAESAGKICIVCGKDVTGQPRVKDAAGRYLCAGECQQKAAAAAKAREAARAAKPPTAPPGVAAKTSAPPPQEPGGLLGQLIADSPMLKSATCESCGNPMPGGAVLCTRCGFNPATGKAIKTAVIVEKEKKEARVKAPSRYSNKYAASDGPGFWKALLVYSAVLSASSLLVFGGPAGFWAAEIIFLIAGLITWVTNIIAAFKNDQMLWGVLMIIPIVNGIAGFIFNLLFNEDTMSRAMYWSLWVGGFVFAAVIGIAIALGFNVDLLSTSLSPVK